MQRRLTIALVSTALISIVLVGFGVLAMAQLSARSNAEEDVTSGLNVLVDFLDGPDRNQRQVEALLFNSRSNLGLDLLEPVIIGPNGGLRQVTERRGPQADTTVEFPELQLDQSQIDGLNDGEIVLVPIDGAVHGLRTVVFELPNQQTTAMVPVLATRRITAVTGQTIAWFVSSSLVVLVGALLAGVWLARRFAGPIKDIQQATAAIAGGNLSTRVEPTGADEVADLGHEVNRMAADLERSKALDRQFLMSVSHDLRTPLTAISGYAEGLADGAVTNPRSAGEVIGNHATRLDRLVDDLLDLARLDANRFQLNPRPFDLSVLAGRTVAGLSNQAGSHGISLQRTGIETIAVNADPDRTAQAIGNLVDNAIKFANSSIDVHIERVDGMAVVSVHDDGPGIPEQDLPHIFERLYTGKAQPERAENPTGLGLAIVRELVNAMGGMLTAANHPDGGALLRLSLPTQDEHQPASLGQAALGNQPPLGPPVTPKPPTAQNPAMISPTQPAELPPRR